MVRIGVIVLIIAAFLFCSLNGYLLISNFYLNKSLKEIQEKKEKEFQQLIHKEQELMQKELENKYKDSAVAFEETFKNLQSEKKKLRDLEEKLGN
jgi:sensor domain CHASE-containing protein